MAAENIQHRQKRIESLIGGGILLALGIPGVILSGSLVLHIQFDNFDYVTDLSNLAVVPFGVGSCLLGLFNFKTGGRLLLDSGKLQLLSATFFAVVAAWLFMYYIFTGLNKLTF